MIQPFEQVDHETIEIYMYFNTLKLRYGFIHVACEKQNTAF